MKTICVIIGMVFASIGVGAADTSVKNDEELDAKLGLNKKPFVVNLSVLKSRAALRDAANVRTGLPSNDQQVETAQEIPAALFALMEQRREAAEEAAFQPEVEENKEPDCYTDENGGVHCE